MAGKAFFEFVNAVVFVISRKTMNAIKIVAFVVVVCGVFNNVPLEFVLSVVIFHVLLVAAGEQINYFVAVEDEHGGREGD